MHTLSEADLTWDPYDPVVDDDPYPVWAKLRERAPVYRNETYDFWAFSRFEDVERASADTATYSSAKGTVLESMGTDMAATGMMIFQDPPEHTALRKLVSAAMTPRRIGGLEDQVRRICGQLLDAVAGSSSFDYVRDYGAQVPSRVISVLVGVPAEDQERMRQLVDGMFHIEPGVGMVNDQAAHSALTLIGYLQDLVQDRRQSPREDMISALVQAEIKQDDGGVRQLTTDECTRFALLLYTAGTETVAKLLGNAAVVLAAHPDQRAELAQDSTLLPGAVDELLRFEPPSPVQGRWTMRDVSLHGVDIPANSKVLLLTGSAGRDPRAYEDADQFDIFRRPRHLSLGHGVHFCLGAALARLEGRVALEETLRRFPEWSVNEAGLERVHTSTVRGYAAVPIVV
jgi:cytochrome P450